jgi:hypothetical protein
MQRCEERPNVQLRVDEVDDVELGVDEERATAVLQDETLLGGERKTNADNEKECKTQHGNQVEHHFISFHFMSSASGEATADAGGRSKELVQGVFGTVMR